MTTVIRKEYWDCKIGQEFRLYLIGDPQLGAAATDEKALAGAIAECANDKEGYAILMGDLIDGVSRRDGRHDERTYSQWLFGSSDPVGLQVEKAIEVFSPIAHKTLAMLTGNHEEKAGQDAHRAMVRGLKQVAGLPFTAPLSLDYGGWLRSVFYRAPEAKRGAAAMLDWYLHHGAGSGGKGGGNAVNKLHDMAGARNADIIAMGHTHRLSAQPIVKEYLDRSGSIRERIVWTINTGSFLRSRTNTAATTYSERGAMSPLACGYVIVNLKLSKREGVHISPQIITV